MVVLGVVEAAVVVRKILLEFFEVCDFVGSFALLFGAVFVGVVVLEVEVFIVVLGEGLVFVFCILRSQ